jgi:hypothetical protein
MQNDAAGEKWQQDICAYTTTNVLLKRAKIPGPHKDLNDWTRAGATADDLLGAMLNAETIGKANDQTASVESEPEAEECLPDFPAECLPPVLERQARGISELCGVPLGMSAPMVLAVASISIGKGLRVRSLPGKVTSGNIYVLVCKTSGSGGTTTFKRATEPLIGMQKTLRREFEEEKKPRIDAEHACISSQIEKLKRRSREAADDEEREQIVMELAELNGKLAQIENKRTGCLLYVTDITPEKLAEILYEQGETLAHIDSDAGDALGIIVGTRYGDGKHTQESLWLKCYTGDADVIFRKNAKPLHLTEPCMAVLFVATPDKVQELFRNSRLTNGGLLPRFLPCDPRARPVPVDVNKQHITHTLPSDVSQPYEAGIFQAIHHYRISAANDPEEIDMTPPARRLIIEDWNRFCASSNGTEDYPFEARHTENAIRIALVLHTFRHLEIKQKSEGTFNAQHHAHEHSLDEQTTRDALRIRDWFIQHQENLRRPQRAAADDDAWHKTQAMMRDRSAAIGITPRDLYSGRRICRDADEAQRLLTQWRIEGRVEPFERKPAEGAGRPTIAYRLAPLVRR